MTFRSRTRRAATASIVAMFLVWTCAAPAAAGRQDTASSQKQAGGTSLAEKIACAWLLVGGAVMLYYGPKERENGQLTMDGKSEAVAGAVSIGISVALLHDILKRRPHAPHP